MKTLLLALASLAFGCSGSVPRATVEHRDFAYISLDTIRSGVTKQFSALSQDRFADLYVLSRTQNALLKYSAKGDSLRAVTGYGAGQYEFNDPSGLDAHYPNRVYVADRLNHRVIEYSRDLAYLSSLITRNDPDPRRRFGYPAGVALDNAGSLFVLDGEGKRVVKFRNDRSYETTFGGYGESASPAGTLSDPTAIAVGADGTVAVLDRRGAEVVFYDNFGTLLSRQSLDDRGTKLAVAGDSLVVLAANGLCTLFRISDRSQLETWQRTSVLRDVEMIDLSLSPERRAITATSILQLQVSRDSSKFQ